MLQIMDCTISCEATLNMCMFMCPYLLVVRPELEGKHVVNVRVRGLKTVTNIYLHSYSTSYDERICPYRCSSLDERSFFEIPLFIM